MTIAGVLTAVSGVAAAGAAGTGFRAAWLWYRASLVRSTPDFGPNPSAPMDPQIGQMMWTGTLSQAAIKSGKLNARAAR